MLGFGQIPSSVIVIGHGECSRWVERVFHGRRINGEPTLKDLATEIKETWRYLEARVEGTSALSTGCASLDQMTGGGVSIHAVTLLVGDVDAMRSLALSIAEEVAGVNGMPVGVFSLARQGRPVGLRFLSAHSGLALAALTPGRSLSESMWFRLMRSAEEVSKLPIFLDDAPLTSLVSLRSRILDATREHDLRLIVVEALDGLAQEGGVALADACAVLHELTHEAHCTVVAWAHREVPAQTRGLRHAGRSAALLARHVDALWSLERAAAEIVVRAVTGHGHPKSVRLKLDRDTSRIEDPIKKRSARPPRKRPASSRTLDLGGVDSD